jgi:ribonuclease-3
LQKFPGYNFRDESLLEMALTHRSVSASNNERLEFLGDALLGAIVAGKLYDRYPDLPEGDLTRLRSSLVKRETLARLARGLDLGDILKLGEGERKSGGWRRDSILSNALEAIIGAVYLDSDFDTCKQFVSGLYEDMLDEINVDSITKDPKTALQEFLQARKLPLPTYSIVAEEGQAHQKKFTVECVVARLDTPIRASGKSKRNAEQAAAGKTLKVLMSGIS